MPQYLKFAELQQQPEDAPVYAAKGKIKSLFKYYNGTGDNGPWSFQDFVLVDAHGVEIKCTLKDRDEMPKGMKDKFVNLLAYHGDRGWSGLKVKADKKKGCNVLWVTKTAEIVEGNGAETGQDGGEAPAPQSSQRQNAPAPQAGGQRQQTQHTADPMSDEQRLKTVKGHVGRARLLWLVCFKAMVATDRELRAEHGDGTGPFLTDEQFQAGVSTLFIEVARKGCCDMMPLPKKNAPAQPAPRQAAPPPPPPPPAPEPEPAPQEPELPPEGEDDVPF